MKKNLIALFAAVMAVGMAFAVDPSIVVSPSTLEPTGTPLQGASADTITIWNYAAGDVTSHYTISETSAWMSSSSSGASVKTNTFDTATISYVTTNLSEGMYTGEITITQTNAPIITKYIRVNLKINQDENLGVALGPSSSATAASGLAVGSRAGRAVAIGANTIQIGAGTSSSAGTTYIRDYELLDSSGVIPAARRGGTLASTTNYALYGVVYSSPGTNIFTYRQLIFVDGQLQSVGASTVTTNAIP